MLSSKKICLDYSSFIHNMSVFPKVFKDYQTYFSNHLNKFQHLSRYLSSLVLGLLVHFSSWFCFIWKNVSVINIVSTTHAVLFSKQEVLKRRTACGSSSESECSWNDRKKKQLEVCFSSMYFVRSNKEIRFSFKNSEN